MKNLVKVISAVLLLSVIAISCSKEQLTGPVSLNGRWTYIGGYASSGGPQYWTKARNTKDYVQLNPDGSMTWTQAPDYKLYTVKDSITLRMTHADGSNYEDFRYSIRKDTLNLAPAGPVVCYEGCSSVFKKSK